MKKDSKMNLSHLDELFTTEEQRQDNRLERIREIVIDELQPFKNHPFQVKNDEELKCLCDSIREYGILTPLMARPKDGGGYEIVSGHRRKATAEMVGMDKLPVLVRDMTDDESVILMADSNIQRENLLPSEKAFAYKMKLEAMKRQAGRPSKENPRQVVGNFESADILGKDVGESGRTIQRYIRLTELVKPILDLVDNQRIAFSPAVELSYLTKDEQAELWDIARTLAYMEHNLLQPHPTVFHEKKHDSKTYGDLMLAAWIRLFDHDNNAALSIAKKWAKVITCAFQSGEYSHVEYVAAYELEFTKLNPKAGCWANFVVLYQLALLPGLLSLEIESSMLDYVLEQPRGIVYIYNSRLDILPEQFASHKANGYLAAMELLSDYSLAPEKLGFVVDWLKSQQDENGLWDMGSAVKDGIHFPLSDSWRKIEDRKRDCTSRVIRLLDKLEVTK